MVKKNSCVFISGKGSNLENLIKKSREYSFPINITSVVTNNNNAAGIRYAKTLFYTLFNCRYQIKKL